MSVGAPTLKSTIGPTVTEFVTVLSDYPQMMDNSITEAITVADGMHFSEVGNSPFASFSRNALINFMHASLQQTGRDAPAVTERFTAAGRGIHLIAMYAELVPLVIMHQLPDEPIPNPDQAAQTVQNGYPFIERLVKGGRGLGTALALNYIEQANFTQDDIWHPKASIEDRKLTETGSWRIARYEVAGMGSSRAVVPMDLDEAIVHFQNYYTDPKDKIVNCSGHIYRDPATGLTQNKRIFDAMVAFAKRNIYPTFLPMAKQALQAS